uniref:Uncharacterized protein n=1 Tax=Siphoviridae sp. ctLnP14 TaxID=2827851 RepID=A0A8S5S834_9CAUD|nr:MAG TPA: Protein of unknown function (DUF3624) [Siphoviridae sp. ctLnP14]
MGGFVGYMSCKTCKNHSFSVKVHYRKVSKNPRFQATLGLIPRVS